MSIPQSPAINENGQSRESDEEPPNNAEMRFSLPLGIFPARDLTEAARAELIAPAVSNSDGGSVSSEFNSLIGKAAQGLFRSTSRHVLVTGARGVGKTTFVDELARRAAVGEIPLLGDRQFLWVGASDVAPEESRDRLAALLAFFNRQACIFPPLPLGEGRGEGGWGEGQGEGSLHVFPANCPHPSPPPEGEGANSAFQRATDAPDLRNLVLCLDGLGAVLRGPGSATNVSLLRGILRRSNMRIVGIMSQWDFDELLAGEPEILELCTRIHFPEPDEATTLAIIRRRAQACERELRCRIMPEALERLVTLSGKFIWNECQPAKSIKILERACEDLVLERVTGAVVGGSLRDPPSSRNASAPFDTDNSVRAGNRVVAQASRLPAADSQILSGYAVDGTSRRAGMPATIGVDHVVRVISEISRVPIAALSGDIDETDYDHVLGAEVIGQDQAVQSVATELRLIRAGITEPNKPASVMLFCGLNGVGKTELAKKLAEIYSASKRLQVYTMANFVEPHSVSGIIGVPAGYVGHDQGGRLINDLNADPYGVFLLDEIEKSHPDVLKPFLNLFDEGWIVDQRGVKAYADRAIFILTSNAGYEAISQMHQDKRPMEEIIEHVKSSLARVRNERSGQPVLSQAFLARIKRILIFNPLGEEALVGIARLMLSSVQDNWKRLRGKTVIVPDELVVEIARKGEQLNDKSGGREGGRGIRRLIDDLVEDRIQRTAASDRRGYSNCRTIRLALTETPSRETSTPGTTAEVSVTFE